MKRHISILLIAVLILSLPLFALAEEGGFGGLLQNVQQHYPQQEDLSLEPLDADEILREAADGKKVTVLAYMCGSNLESMPQSSASKDIQEMIASGYDTDCVNLLLMPGGARKWHITNINNKETGIYCVRPDGITKLHEFGEQLNMGAPETLSAFLQYGYTHFPAERYALVIWDHGGGSIGGVCHDENSKDHLSLAELKAALENSPAAQTPLEWVGFDACLMASAEVSMFMAPYARYMIASEETEPGYGWDYQFLRDIEKDASGAETGSRIVQQYLDWYGENCPSCEITLSCIDLSAMSQLADRLDRYFVEAADLIHSEGASVLSKAVRQAKFFGNVEENDGDDMTTNANVYDLADLGSLIACLDEYLSGDGKELIDFLHKDVVVKNENTLNLEISGLTLYHPLRAKNAFRSNIETYRALGIIPNYVNYIETFGKMLLDEPAAGFSGLLASFTDEGKVRRSLVSLPLNEDQVRNLAEYQLIALQRSGEEEAYHMVSVSDRVRLDESGTLKGEFVFRNLFLTEPDGTPVAGVPPLFFTLNAEGQYLLPAALCSADPDTGEEIRSRVYLVCEAAPDSPALNLVSVLTYDEFMQCYTSRVSPDLRYVKAIEFDCVDCVPTRDASGALLGFEEWTPARVSTFVWRVDEDYQLRFLDNSLEESSIFVAFSLMDTQSNTYTSELIPLASAVDEGVVRLSYDDRDQLILLHDPRCEALPGVGLVIAVDVDSIAQAEILVRMGELTINGIPLDTESELFGAGPNMGLLPEEEQTLLVMVGGDALADVTTVESFGFTLTVSDAASGEETARIPVEGIARLTLG